MVDGEVKLTEDQTLLFPIKMTFEQIRAHLGSKWKRHKHKESSVAYVYFLLGSDKEILYVGKTDNLLIVTGKQ